MRDSMFKVTIDSISFKFNIYSGDYGSGFYIYAKPLHEPLLHHLIFFLPLIVSFYAT